MRREVQAIRLDEGLQTSWPEDGMPFPYLEEAQDIRLRGTLRRRNGYRRIARVTNENNAYSFNGSSQYVTIPYDARIHDLKRRWTLEALVAPSTFATNARTLFGVAHASDYGIRLYYTTAGLLEAKVQDSAGTVVTLTSASTFTTDTTYGVQLVRDSTTLVLRVNGATEDSDTMADLDCKVPGGNLYLMRDNAGLYFGGTGEWVRMFNTARSSQAEAKMRLVHPRSPDVLFDYALEDTIPSGSIVQDRSRYENHGITAGSPSETTSLGVQCAPVQGLRAWADSTAKHRMLAFIGRELYYSDMVL